MKIFKKIVPALISVVLGAIFFVLFFQYLNFLKNNNLTNLYIYPILSFAFIVLLIIFVFLYSFNKYIISSKNNYHLCLIFSVMVMNINNFFLIKAFVMYPIAFDLTYLYKLKNIIIMFIVGISILDTFNFNIFFNTKRLSFFITYILFCVIFAYILPNIYDINSFVIVIIYLNLLVFFIKLLKELSIAIKNREKEGLLKILYEKFLCLALLLCVFFDRQETICFSLIFIVFSLFLYVFINKQFHII